MSTRALVIIGAVVAAAIIYFRPYASMWLVRRKCTASVGGHYVYTEWFYQAQGIGGGHSTALPAYEYTVDGKLYLTLIEGMEQDYNVFPLDVEVKYNPSNPEVCFIEGKRGTAIKGKNRE